MSFTVKAGGNTVTSPGTSFQTPSPQLTNAATPGGYQRSGGSNSHINNNNNNSIPPPFTLATSTESSSVAMDGGLGAHGGNGKRTGTDPTKYKTTICRNWEQAGTCVFRGCTFAHGVDDLRPPMRSNTSPVLTHQPSPGATPPLYPQGFGGSSSHHNMALPPSSSASGSATLPRAEQLMELLLAEIHRERDLVSVHTEANKTLESMLRKEQQQHAETAARAEGLANQAIELTRQVSERNAEILRLLEVCGSSLTGEQRRRAESLASWNFGTEGHSEHTNNNTVNIGGGLWDAPSSRSNEQHSDVSSPTSNQLKELLHALRLQQQQQFS